MGGLFGEELEGGSVGPSAPDPAPDLEKVLFVLLGNAKLLLPH